MLRAAATLFATAAVVAGCGGAPRLTSAPQAATRAAVHQPSRGTRVLDSVAPDFALRDQNGDVVRLSAQRGNVVLLTFLYTECRDVCPLIAAKLGAALRAVSPEDRRRVRVLAISVDPEHDTRAAVRRFVRRLSLPPQFHYLTGTLDELRPIWQGYNLTVDVRNVEVVDHSAYVLLLDAKGKPRLYYRPSFGERAMLADLRSLLRET